MALLLIRRYGRLPPSGIHGTERHALFLHGLSIAPCKACMACRKPGSKGCSIDDDMQAIDRKRIAAAMAYGGADPFDSGCVNALRTFQDACRYAGAQIVGMVYGGAMGAGDIRADRALLKAAKALGRELADGHSPHRGAGNSETQATGVSVIVRACPAASRGERACNRFQPMDEGAANDRGGLRLRAVVRRDDDGACARPGEDPGGRRAR